MRRTSYLSPGWGHRPPKGKMDGFPRPGMGLDLRPPLKSAGAAVCLLALALLGGCFGRTAPAVTFESPIESRLILQAPYFSDPGESGAAGALAEVLTYNGRPSDPGKVRLALDGRLPTPQILTVMARGEGLKAEFRQGAPEDLLAAVRNNQPAIVRLGTAAPPLGQGDYAVVVGYTPEGPVVNSGHINQQIVPWANFLSGWHSGGNIIILIEPN